MYSARLEQDIFVYRKNIFGQSRTEYISSCRTNVFSKFRAEYICLYKTLLVHSVVTRSRKLTTNIFLQIRVEYISI